MVSYVVLGIFLWLAVAIVASAGLALTARPSDPATAGLVVLLWPLAVAVGLAALVVRLGLHAARGLAALARAHAAELQGLVDRIAPFPPEPVSAAEECLAARERARVWRASAMRGGRDPDLARADMILSNAFLALSRVHAVDAECELPTTEDILAQSEVAARRVADWDAYNAQVLAAEAARMAPGGLSASG